MFLCLRRRKKAWSWKFLCNGRACCGPRLSPEPQEKHQETPGQNPFSKDVFTVSVVFLPRWVTWGGAHSLRWHVRCKIVILSDPDADLSFTSRAYTAIQLCCPKLGPFSALSTAFPLAGREPAAGCEGSAAGGRLRDFKMGVCLDCGPLFVWYFLPLDVMYHWSASVYVIQFRWGRPRELRTHSDYLYLLQDSFLEELWRP